MPKFTPNPSFPTSRSRGEADNTLRPMPPDSNPFLGDPLHQTTNAIAYLTGLRPPNMSHRAPHLNEKTESLWFVTMREVAFHFSKIGEAIDQCANETERLVQSHQGGDACNQSAKSPSNVNRQLHGNGVNGHPHSIGQCPNGNRALHSQNDRNGYSVAINDSGHSNSKPRRVRQPPIYPNTYVDGQQVQMPIGSFGLKRSPPLSVSELDHRSRQPFQVVPLEHAENVRAYLQPRFPRPHKRIRINWTEEEDSLFFDTIRKNSTKDEQTVLREIVSALGGSRSWIQCKGHFRNLFAVGRITRGNDESKSWIVHPDVNGKEKEETKKPSTEEKAKSQGKASKHTSPRNSSNGTANGNLKDAIVSTSNPRESDDNISVGKTQAKTTNGEVRRSVSIDSIINPTSQDENELSASNMQKPHNQLNREHGPPDYHVSHKNNAEATKKVYVVPQSTRVSEQQDFEVSRIRETAIFMSKQAAAKEAYERSNCEPAGEKDLRKV